jgi:iron complex outermembrane receptor protein
MFRKIPHRTHRGAGWRSVGTGLWLLVNCGFAAAAEPPAVARYAIEQPSQALAEALRSIARQTGTSVLFDPGAVAGRVARPVSGRLSAIEAISAALAGSGLTAELMKDGAVVVKPAASPAAMPAAPASGGPVSNPAVGPGERSGGDAQGNGARVLAASDDDASAAASAPDRNGRQELTRVEVTGSRLKRLAAEGPAPVNVYTAKDIERSGQPNLQRFLAGLNEVSASQGEGGFGNTLGQGTVQLRGLPLGSTLVLVNGRRLQAMGSSSANFFNINLIPMAAVERVEIVPVGSSAVYGGDALAGVVNIILKKSIDGQSLAVRLGSGRGLGDGSVSLATGGHDESGSYLVMGSYSRASPLTMAEREFFRNGDYRRFGGPDARERNCTPGTVSSLSGGNLPGLSSSFAGIPSLAPGQVPTVSDFAPTAGSANLCNVAANGNGFALVHAQETMSVHALAERQLGGSWSVFGELTLARERMHAKEIGLTLTDVTVPATNPYNPFGEDVSVTTILGTDNGTQGLARHTRFTRAVAGLRGELAHDWDAEVTVSTSRDSGGSRDFNLDVDGAALDAALAATTPAQALNPFTTGIAASEEVLRGIWSDSLRQSRGRKDQLGGLVRGTVMQLPAGPLEAIVGAEVARDRYDVSIPGSIETHVSRRDSAAYGELRLPLFSQGSSGSAGSSLAALTLAARRDRYSDFGSAGTYQAGLELRPTRSLLFRASAATSFKPPTMLQTNVDEASFPLEWFGLVDPARGGEPITSGRLVRDTNKDLGPERGRANGIGAVWEPEGSLGTRFSITHWQVRVRGLIAVLRAQTVLDNEALFPGMVTRGPSAGGQPGPVTSVRLAEVNVGRLEAGGSDFEVGYAWRSDWGRWTATAGATRTSRYDVVLAPGAPTQDRLGRRFDDFWAPRWKGRLSLGLEQGAWSLGLTSRYLGRYLDSGTSDRSLGGFWMHDLAGSLDLKKWWPGLGANFKAASLSLSVANLANREPQFVQTMPYYDVTQADWRGRYVSVRLSLDW